MVRRVQIYEIELIMLLKNFVKLMQVHMVFDLIYLQYLYRHHEKEVHEYKLPKKKFISIKIRTIQYHLQYLMCSYGQESHSY